MLSIGDKAPDLDIITWPEYRGPISRLWQSGPLILFFYPMDNTPVCTKQACSLRDNLASFAQFDAGVLGSSTGSLKSHEKFAEKQGLSFPLVADKGSKLAKAYGATRFLVPVSKRITYVIGRDGVIKGVCHDETNVSAHLTMIRETLDG